MRSVDNEYSIILIALLVILLFRVGFAILRFIISAAYPVINEAKLMMHINIF